MEFLSIQQTTGFRHPVFGEGTLVAGKTYYTFGQFARETAAAGIGRIIRGEAHPPVRFLPSHLANGEKFRKVLILFSGGFGDAITLGIVVRAAIEKHGIGFDLCCDRRKWDSVFKPMGMPCLHIPYPPEQETLSRYDATLSSVEDFLSTGSGLSSSPVIDLAAGFGVDPDRLRGDYTIPPEVVKAWRLPSPGAPRVGVNFDSNGRVKSYPDKLQGPLLKTLLDSGLELYLLGTRQGVDGGLNIRGLRDLRGKIGILESAALLGQMNAVVGVDSFVVHLAHLLGVPSVVLLSTTTPTYFAWHKRMMCLPSRLECSPCFEVFDRCPLGYPECRAFTHESMAPEVISERLLQTVSAETRNLSLKKKVCTA